MLFMVSAELYTSSKRWSTSSVAVGKAEWVVLEWERMNCCGRAGLSGATAVGQEEWLPLGQLDVWSPRHIAGVKK
jgi:hypothetical protein